jgi:hypothetical protein
MDIPNRTAEAARVAEPCGRALTGVLPGCRRERILSLGEFEALTALGLMEYITPEEIADNVAREIRGQQPDARLAENGWVDLRPGNWRKWRERAATMLQEARAFPGPDQGSRIDVDRAAMVCSFGRDAWLPGCSGEKTGASDQSDKQRGPEPG